MEKDFILYQVGHYGFLINAMIHKLSHHKNDKAIFLLDKVIMSPLAIDFVENNKDNFKPLGDLVVYNDMDIITRIRQENPDEPELTFVDYFSNLLKKHSINLAHAKEIYSIFDTFNAFGAFLTIKGIPYSMIEGVAGQCQSEKRYFLNNNYKQYDEIIHKYRALSCNCPMVKALYCAAQASIKIKPYYEYQSDIELIKHLDYASIRKVINVYGIEFKNFPKDADMIVFSSGWIIGDLKMRLVDYYYAYQKLLDYYVADRPAFLKPHPNLDFPIDEWKKFFPKNEVVPGYFPSLLVSYINDFNVSRIYSTSYSAVDGKDSKTKSIPFRYFYTHKLFHKLYYAYSLAHFLNIDPKHYEHFGMHNDITWSFQRDVMNLPEKSVWSVFNFAPNSFTIIDDINWNKDDSLIKCINKMRELDNNAVIVFMNTKADFIFMDKDQTFVPYIIPVHIKKRATKPNALESLNDEIVYVFCKDHKTRSTISSFSFVKQLNTVGINLSVEKSATPDLDIVNMKLDYLIKSL